MCGGARRKIARRERERESAQDGEPEGREPGKEIEKKKEKEPEVKEPGERAQDGLPFDAHLQLVLLIHSIQK